MDRRTFMVTFAGVLLAETRGDAWVLGLTLPQSPLRRADQVIQCIFRVVAASPPPPAGEHAP